MFVAKDGAGNLVDISDADRHETYFCPGCNEALIQRHGRLMTHHFAHKSGAECVTNWEPMTDWHLNWQKEFPIETREVVLIKDKQRRRADVMLDDIVIEFQHSPISEGLWTDRVEFYNGFDKSVLWVYDRRDFKVHPDLFGYVSLGYDVIFLGDSDLGKKELAREHEQTGSMHPVALDYGDFVVLLWYFVKTCSFSGQRSLATRSAVMSRARFVELMLALDANHVNIDLQFDTYVREHELWFVCAAQEVASEQGQMYNWAEMFGQFVVLKSFLVCKNSRLQTKYLGKEFVACYLQDASIFERPDDKKIQAIVASEYQSGECTDIFQIDSFMIAHGVLNAMTK